MKTYQPNIPINLWAEEERPREKFIQKGRTALSDAELLAILINTGTKKHSAVDLGRKLLATANNDLNQIAKKDVSELAECSGIGEAKAVRILTALELGRRRKRPDPKQLIKSSSDAYHIIQPYLADLNHEEFWVIGLSRSNAVQEVFQLSKGGVTGTVADVKLMFRKLTSLLASGVIVCHNHPSGNIKPSESDIRLTSKIQEAGQIMDVVLLDHLIVGEGTYYSFADEGNIL